MNTKFLTLEKRKDLLRSFYDLPPKDKEMLYQAVEHLRWLTILWGLEKPSSDSMPSNLAKRHILLAYKLLEILWFSKLPERDHQIFAVYIRNRLPDDQDPQVVNGIFNLNSNELAARSENMTCPKWLTKEAKAIKISLESFPYQA